MTKKTERRKIKNFLPAIFQTPINEKFFYSTVDQAYQPQNTEEINGFIGKITNYYNSSRDFYIEESTKERKNYQFSPVVVSKDSKTGEIKKELFYEDLINYLKSKGSLINNHQRLFDSNYYSWCPNIDLDKLMNYRDYYWVPFGPSPIEISEPTDLDSVKNTENFSLTVNGETIKFSSGLRIKPLNDLNPFYNNKIFIVEGVGRAITFVEDEISFFGWDLNLWDKKSWDELGFVSFEPDYITIERGSYDNNLWSRSNRWFHRDVITNFNDPNLLKIKATRPIIEFEKNIELWNHGSFDRGNVDIIVHNADEFFNSVNGRKPNMPTTGISLESGLPTIANGTIEVDEIAFGNDWPFADLGFSQLFYTDKNGVKYHLRDGLKLLMLSDSNSFIKNKILEITGIKSGKEIILQILNNGINPDGSPAFDERITHKTFVGSQTVYRYDGVSWVIGQTKTKLNQPPLFQLYDVDKISLNDPVTYPKSSFAGNKIFSYKEDDNFFVDKVLNMKIKRNNLNEIVFENSLISETYTYEDEITKETKNIYGYYFYKIIDEVNDNVKYINNWHLVPTSLNQYYKLEFTSKDGTTEFYLDLKPDFPLLERNNTESKSLLVKINDIEKELGVDFNYDSTLNKIILTEKLKNDEILEVFIISDNKSSPSSNLGVYEIPFNLIANANNEEIHEAGLNQLFDHFYANIKNQKNLEGNLFLRNTYRDTKKERFLGNKILQHEASLLKLMLLSSDKDFDLVEIIRWSKKEYFRFKNKFIRKISSINITTDDISELFNKILKEINVGKNNEFVFRNSGVADLGTLELMQTFIPPSTAYLGITKLYKPEIYIDDTYINPIKVIRGHDGSIYPAFDDFRDDLLLYFENLIYDSAPDKFKDDYLPLISEYDVLPGKYRQTDYSLEEITTIFSSFYECWLVENRVGFTKNSYFEDRNEKNINYTNSFDYTGKNVIGSWRALFLWFYDTDTPHITPWEMLGFGKKPDWWDDEYGPKPYTRGNFKLWNDLKQGLIRQGKRKGIDKRFERPDLLSIIPVDDIGNLRNPIEIGLVKETPSVVSASKDWEFGEIGPIEKIWRNSSEFPFDLASLIFLTKPAKFVDLNWDSFSVERIFTDLKETEQQLIIKNYKKRITASEDIIHDEFFDSTSNLFVNNEFFVNNDNFVRRWGINQLISNYLFSKGKDITTSFGNLIRNLSVVLGYKTAGFIDSNYFIASSESFGNIPKENITIKLYKSNPIKYTSYSGVIIERKSNGYNVYGYDSTKQYFNVIPSDIFGRKVKVGIGSKPLNVNDWLPNTNYIKEDIVLFENNLYKALVDHLSKNIFEDSKWVLVNNIPKEYEISVIKYLDPKLGEPIEKVKYGTFFKTVQEVYNFLIEYERFLKKEGFIFDNYDKITNEIIDFNWSGKEFLSWVLTNPVENEILSLSPLAEKVKYKVDFGTVAPIEEITQNFYSILNRDGIKIDPSQTVVTRLNNLIEINPVNPDDLNNLIYMIKMNIISVEHVVLFDNFTIFNDVIYDPLYNIKVDRLRLAILRAKDWEGRYEAQGFLINDNKLIPNFDKLSDQFRYVFDIENFNFVEKLWRDYGFHLIGFQNRKYLDNIIISDKSQINFYQGMIRQKGTSSSLTKLLRSEFISKISDLLFFEEWFFRIGTYGNYIKKPSLTIRYNKFDFKENPHIISFEKIPIPESILVGNSFPSDIEMVNYDYFYNSSEKKLYSFDKITKEFSNISWEEYIDTVLLDNPNDNILKIITITDNDNIVLGDDKRWLIRPEFYNSVFEDWLFKTTSTKTINYLPNAGYFKINEAKYFLFNKEDLVNFYNEQIKTNQITIEENENIVFYNVTTMLNSKFNQTLNNKDDSWSIFKFLKYKRNISNVTKNDNGDLKILFNFAEILPINDENKYQLNNEETNIDNILVAYNEKENKISVSSDSYNILGYVYNINTSAISIVSGQTIVIDYNDDVFENSISKVEFNEYISGKTEYYINKKPTNLNNISFGYVSEASATYTGNLTSFSVFVSSTPLTGESIWINYSPVIDNQEIDDIYTEVFVSDGINQQFTLTYKPVISSINVKKGFVTNISADNFVEEKNPFIELILASSFVDFKNVWIKYTLLDGTVIEEIYEKTSSTQLFRLSFDLDYDQEINVSVGSAKETKFLNPLIEFDVSSKNILDVFIPAPENSELFVYNIIKDPYTETLPTDHFTTFSAVSTFSLSTIVTSSVNCLVFVNGILKNKNFDYTISANSNLLKFNNLLEPNSNIWVYYINEPNSNIDNFVVSISSLNKFTISDSNFSVYDMIVTVNDYLLKPIEDYIVSGNTLILNENYPLNSKIYVRYFNNILELKEKDLLLFDYSNIEDNIVIEGFKEIVDITQLGEIVVSSETADNAFDVSNNLDFNKPKNIFVLKEIRFLNFEDYKNETNSFYYNSSFSSPNKNEIIFIDDGRLSNENNLQKYYRIITVSDFWNNIKNEDDLISKTIRIEEEKVDTTLIYNAEIFNEKTNQSFYIELYDPYKGIIPGIADREIFYKLDFDPAVYNFGDASIHNIDKNNFWGDEQVGRVWWDLRTVRFLDYEIDSVEYRRLVWGKIAPNTRIDVYEWVKSEVPPEEYDNQTNNSLNDIVFETDNNIFSGETYFKGNTPYSSIDQIDKETGAVKTYYYFWVKNKISLPNVNFRKLTVYEIAKIIENPTENNIIWFSPISKNSVMFANIFPYLEDNETSLKITWNLDNHVDEKGNWHKQWIIGREKDPDWIIDDLLYTKFTDSLVGYNKDNEVVPDPILNENEKYGNLIRPRQSWFKNRNLALFNFIEFVNYIFEKMNLTKKLNGFDDLIVYDLEPSDVDFIVDDISQRDFLISSNIAFVGSKILVNKNLETGNFWTVWEVVNNNPIKVLLHDYQKYSTEDFLSLSDYYDETIDKNSPPNKIYNDILERDEALQNNLINEGEIILIKNVGGFWEWQRFENNNFTVVARQNSTYKFSDKFYKNTVVFGINENISEISVSDFRNLVVNRDGRLELRKLLEIFKNGYFENTSLLNEIFFNMVRYSLTENKVVDWVFKSSYVLFGGLTENIGQDSIVRLNLFDSIFDYLMEMKPYHTKFRNFYRRISTPIDEYNTNVLDFDFGSDEYNAENVRKIKTKQKFDRVSCDTNDNDPVKIKIVSDGKNNSFDLIINGTTVVTEPFDNTYEVYKTSGKQIWDKNFIEFVEIKKSDLTIERLDEIDWDIIEVTSTSTNSNFFKLVLNTIPEKNSIIEIKRRLTAIERIDRYYEVITKLINGKNVTHIIPKKSKGLIKNCEFSRTVVEGGALVYSLYEFNLATKNNKLIASWDIQPDINYIQDNIKPPYTPDGLLIDNFISANGIFWVEKYYETYSASYPMDVVIRYLNTFYSVYSWDMLPWDGEVDLFDTENYSNEDDEILDAEELYDNILESGTQLSGYPGYEESTSTLSIWPPVNSSSLALMHVIEGNKFIQPYYGPDRPEELYVVKNNDPFIIDVISNDIAGASIVKEFKKLGILENNFQVKFEVIPQSKEAVFAFINGILLEENEDYVIDWEKQTLTYIGPTTSNVVFLVKYYTLGGDNILYSLYYKANEATTGFYGYTLPDEKSKLFYLSAQNFFVVIDGVCVSSVNVVNNELFVDLSGISISANSTVNINLFKSNEIIKIRTTKYFATSGSSHLDLKFLSGSEKPVDQSMLVFLSGLRYSGTNQRYFVTNNNIIDVGIELSGSLFDVYIDNIKIDPVNYNILSSNPTILQINDVFTSEKFITVQIYDGEYFVDEDNKKLIFNSNLNSDKVFKVVTFNKNNLQKIRTEKFEGNNEGVYKLSLIPENKFVFWAHVDGYTNSYDLQYLSNVDNFGFDEGLFGIQDFGEGPQFLKVDFQTNHSGKSVYITYTEGKEKSEPYSLRKYIPLYDEKENLKILNENIYYLKEDVTIDSENIEVYENYRYYNGIINNFSLTIPDPWNNQPGIIWIDGERIEYWKLTGPLYDINNYRYWILEGINRRTKESSRGVELEKETYMFSGDNTTTNFYVPTSATLTENNISVTLLEYSLIDYIWDDVLGWDAAPFDAIPEIINETPINVLTSSTVVDISSNIVFKLSGNTVVFNQPITESPLNSILIDSSGSSLFYPLKNIKIDVVVRDWNNSVIEHKKNTKVISGNLPFLT